MEQRILIHTPIGKDAFHVCQVLTPANIEYFVCKTSQEVIEELNKGAAALLLVEETLTADFLKSITGFLQKQKAWSDLPILLLCKRGLDSIELRSIYLELGNVTLIERPLQIITLVTTISSALRARMRQYEMREVDRRKDEFLAMLAHELRNPLAPISAASQILKHGDLTRERTDRTSEIILRQVSHMTGLIDDLLDLSRVSRGLIELKSEINLVGDILSYAIEQVMPLIKSKSHNLEVKADSRELWVQGDHKRLIQILSNLINNAAKYTPDGGLLTVSLDYNDTFVVFTVTDNGLGIDPDIIDSLFEMFAQATRTPDRAQGGLGIGLALVKNLVELHGGTVSAESKGLGHGSKFSVTLPRALETIQQDEIDTGRPASTLPATRLLVVDDNQDAADTLGMYLETLGYEVSIEYSANAALDVATVKQPTIYLLDIGLPDMDGNELARRIRAKPEGEHALLIAISGYGQAADRQLSSDSGFDHHFVKPVKLDALLNVIQNSNPRAGHNNLAS